MWARQACIFWEVYHFRAPAPPSRLRLPGQGVRHAYSNFLQAFMAPLNPGVEGEIPCAN